MKTTTDQLQFSEKNEPLVSVVVTTRNEEKNIENCLISINEQTYSNIESIVVDNNSRDSTKKISEKYTEKIYNKGPERSAQRNYGMIDKSAGSYVMFVDADMILAPSLIEACISRIQAENVIALHIPEIVLGSNYFCRVRRFEREFYNGTVIDGARFFSRKEFTMVGGFDETLCGPEDWDIDKKIKQIGRIELMGVMERAIQGWVLEDFIRKRGGDPIKYSNVIFHNESDFRLREYLNKKSYYSGNLDVYKNKWGNDDDIRKQLGIWYRYIGVFVENRKVFKLLKNPRLTVGMYFLRLLVGIRYLMTRRKAPKLII